MNAGVCPSLFSFFPMPEKSKEIFVNVLIGPYVNKNMGLNR
jgi:hypothetical protein